MSLFSRVLDDVVADATVAQVVVDQLLVQRLELHTPVGLGAPARQEGRRLHEDEMFKGAGRRLGSRVVAIADRPALHEDDGMVAILPRNGR